MDCAAQLYGDYVINHDIRIPSLTNEDLTESKGPWVFWNVART